MKRPLSSLLVRLALCLSGLLVADRLVVPPLIRCGLASDQGRREATSARWFALHALANFVLCALTFGDVLLLLRSPLRSLDAAGGASSSPVPLCLVNALHLYHALAFEMRRDELVHHLLFLPTCGLAGVLFEWGPLANYLCFFICGLPGGLTYALLSAQRCGLLCRVDEPALTARLTHYVRLPGIVSSSAFFCLAYAEGFFDSIPAWALLVQLLMPLWNALKYADESVRRSERRRLEAAALAPRRGEPRLP